MRTPAFIFIALLAVAFVTTLTLAQATSAQQRSREIQPQAPPADRPMDADTCFESMLDSATEIAYCDGVISQLNGRSLDFAQTRALAAAYNNRALNLTQQSEAALDDLHAAIELLPQWAELHLNLGNLYLRAADYPAALAAYDQALQLSQGDLRAAYFNRAFVHRALGQPLNAQTDLLLWHGILNSEQAAEDEQAGKLPGRQLLDEN